MAEQMHVTLEMKANDFKEMESYCESIGLSVYAFIREAALTELKERLENRNPIRSGSSKMTFEEYVKGIITGDNQEGQGIAVEAMNMAYQNAIANGGDTSNIQIVVELLNALVMDWHKNRRAGLKTY